MKKYLKYLSAMAFGVLLISTASLTVSADETETVTEAVTTSVTDITETTSETTVSETAISTVTDLTETTPTEITDISETTTELSDTETSSSDVTTTVTTITTKVTVTCPEINESIVNGWNRIDGKWYYFDGKEFMTGKHRLDYEYYIFANNGALRTGWQTINGIRRFYDSETHSPVYGWVDYRGHRYYTDKKTGKLTGLQVIDGNTYLFTEQGIMQTGFVMHGDYMFYCGENGAIIYGDDKRTPILIGENYHLISPKGYVLRGWQTVNGRRCFYDYDTALPVNGWVQFMDNAYYVDKVIGKYTGKRYIENHPYIFADNGILQTGLIYFKEENVTSYFFNDGRRAVSEIVHTDNGSYYFDENGYMKTGWIVIDETYYYFDEYGKMALGVRRIDGNMYYFGEDGKMRTGLQSAEGTKYLLDENGIMQFGWQTVQGKTYYFKTADGKAYSGWNKIDGETYYFGKDFSLAKEWLTINGYTYYLGDDGVLRTGWQTIDGKTYYFSTDKDNTGAMYTYRHNIDGEDYLFYSTGVMETDGNQKIVVKAISQLGQEGGQPYWTWWGFNFRIEWCACFVSWCATQCGYTQDEQIPKFISCKVGIDWFKNHKQWMGRDYIPKPGDFIFFDWEPDSVADHIGIVDYYEDGYVYTVEGNSSDEVRKRVYDIKSEEIYGFAAPNFTLSKGFE